MHFAFANTEMSLKVSIFSTLSKIHVASNVRLSESSHLNLLAYETKHPGTVRKEEDGSRSRVAKLGELALFETPGSNRNCSNSMLMEMSLNVAGMLQTVSGIPKSSYKL